MLTKLAISVGYLQLAGCFSTGNRNIFLYVEGSTAWLHHCPQSFSPLLEANKNFDCMPIGYQYTVNYLDYLTRQIFIYATPISCDNNPQKTITIDTDIDEHYVLTPKHV